MAYTVPSGYGFYDKSAGKWYLAGETFSGTPGNGDYMYPITEGTKPWYFYYSARSVDAVPRTSDDPEAYTKISVSAGWECNVQPKPTFTSVTPLSTLFGKSVVCINVLCNTTDKLTTINSIPSTIEYLKVNGSSITTIKGTMPTALKYFCAYNSNLKTVPSLSSCTKWKYGFGAFEKTKLTSAPAIPSSLVYVDYMFDECTSLTTGVAIPSSAISARYMYYHCTSLKTAPVNNSSSLTTQACIFSGCTSMTACNYILRTGSAYSAFMGCTSLTTLPSVGSNVTELSYCFSECSSVINPPSIESNASLMYTFRNCTSLVRTPIFQDGLRYMQGAFLNCTSLTTIESLPSSLYNMDDAFSGCTSLEYIPELPSGITGLSRTFYGCTSLRPQNFYIPGTNVNSIYCMLQGCENYKGIITFEDMPLYYSGAFARTAGPVILTGNVSDQGIINAGPNVYVDLNLEINSYSTTRCSDMNGTLDDNGDYCRIIVSFNTPVPDDSDLYVPKIYIGNAQQQPLKNWVLTDNDLGVSTEIPNSTDIQATRIHAGDLIANGTFETYVAADSSNVTYKIFIASSADNVYLGRDSQDEWIVGTKYWNGLAGSAIYTGDTYIFDAVPDGSAFKIGGGIDESSETGFIVGNPNISLVSDQYPSTFNGPVTMNSTTDFNSPITVDSTATFDDEVEFNSPVTLNSTIDFNDDVSIANPGQFRSELEISDVFKYKDFVYTTTADISPGGVLNITGNAVGYTEAYSGYGIFAIRRMYSSGTTPAVTFDQVQLSAGTSSFCRIRNRHASNNVPTGTIIRVSVIFIKSGFMTPIS